jgi:hypothetical protein
MAMFQQYQGGIAPVQGISEAGARIGQMAQGGMVDFGKSLSEGIKAYNDNSAKSEMANVKIQSLSQDIANKISMYSQDPEIAQSGILQGLMQKGQMLTEAPSKGLSQRLAIAHDAETSLAGFGQQLQEWSFLRGRAIERGIQQGLDLFKNTKSITSPVFYDGSDPELSVDQGQNIQQQKDRVLKRFREIKAANPQLEGTEEQFWANWISKAEQDFSKGVNGIPPTVASAQLEALQAERNILKSQSDVNKLDAGAVGGLIMNKDGLYEEQANVSVPVKDYEATMKSADEKVYENTKQGMDFLFGYTDKPKTNTALNSELEQTKTKIAELKSSIKSGNTYAPTTREKGLDYLKSFGQGVGETLNRATADAYLRRALEDTSGMSDEQVKQLITKHYDELIGTWKKGAGLGAAIADLGSMAGLQQFAPDFLVGSGRKGVAKLTTREEKLANEAWELASSKAKAGQSSTQILNPTDPKKQLEALENYGKVLEKNIKAKEKEDNIPARPVSPRVALKGDVVVGSTTYDRPVSVSERKSQVQDFLTERFGAIDPTDPTGKRRIPVQGFESFFAKAVPESEIKEFTTESGQKLIHLNGKWEMVKSAEPRSLADIRKDMVGVYGKQTADGRLVPTEFIPNSGIEIGGLYRGTDASEAQFNDEMTQLSDARRSIRKLQEINDSVGEFADLTKAGIAEVEVMNLKSALRKDIIGVGTVSNFEQSLIDKVIRNPTDFFSMESKDRAILLALAQRIDRRIQNIGAAKGLTVRIRDVDSGNRYEALRQQYLKAKGLL